MPGFIELQDVKKVYRTGEMETIAVQDVNFVINKGEFCIVVGPSGAGKTTVLNLLGGMDSVTSGKIYVDGTDISALSPKAVITYRRLDIGFVFQFYNLVQNLTALENVELATQISQTPLAQGTLLKGLGWM